MLSRMVDLTACFFILLFTQKFTKSVMVTTCTLVLPLQDWPIAELAFVSLWITTLELLTISILFILTMIMLSF